MPGAFDTTPYVPPAAAPYQTTQAQAKEATAVGYDPSAFTVDKNQTVASQLEGLIDKDSPYIKQAETRAAQRQNELGTLNSTMAISAGRAAAIDAALPIANADAGTFDRAMTNTKNAENAAKQFTAGAQNTASGMNAQLGTNVSLSNASEANKSQAEAYQAGTQLSLAGVDASTRLRTAALDADTRLSLGQLDANTRLALGQLDAATRVQIETLGNQYKVILQSDTNAANAFNQVVQNISQIAQNSTMTQDAKNAATQTQIDMLSQQMQATAAIGSSSPSPTTPLSQVTSLNLGNLWTGTVGSGSTPGATDTKIPEGGGWRDAQGNVYYGNGMIAPWKGPTGQPVGTPLTPQAPSAQNGYGPSPVNAPDQYGIVNNGNGTFTFNGRTFPTFLDAYQAYAQ